MSVTVPVIAQAPARSTLLLQRKANAHFTPNVCDDSRNIDLNTLRLFQEIYDTCSLSRAADRVGLTQPAVSIARGVSRLTLPPEPGFTLA